MKYIGLFFLFFFVLFFNELNAQTPVQVKIFKKNFPTYNLGPGQPMPYLKDFNVPGMSFFRGSRSVYPYTFKDDYRPGKNDKDYEVVRLENEFIYVDIIPELRGRIQGAVDKRNNWDFLYYNHVIKPAEISVRSAWISGGLEYNHPQGHGYTQFDKISYDIKEGADGSKTVIIAEIEPVRMMKWEYEIILRPGKLYLETKGRFISTSPFPVPFLSSNNAAMHTTPEMELVYTQNTYASNHAFKDMKKWPLYGTDDADWNWLKNIKTQASAFVDGTGLNLDFWGVYSHDKGIDAGTVIVSDHRVAPGKKFFTWGSHDFGKQWDHFLSDTDGGYVELQQQAYYANLGYGYAVLDPFEVKEFSVFWYPIKSTGGFVKATKDVVVNFKRTDEKTLKLDIEPTSDFKNCSVEIYKNRKQISVFPIDLHLGEVINRQLKLSSLDTDTLEIRIQDANHQELISYANKIDEIKPEINQLPNKKDADLSIDQLYFKGISNYHDPDGTDAEVIFSEIFKRDSLESRANRQMGIISIKRGKYPEAIKFLKRSLVNDHFESCYKTHLLLGYAYLQLNDLTNAHVHLVQSSRKKDELDASLFYLAQTEIKKGNLNESIRYLEEIPVSRLTHPDIYNLKAFLYAKLGDQGKANDNIENAFNIDPLNFVAYTQKLALSTNKEELIQKINFLFDRKDSTFLGSQLYIETALFYMNLNDYNSALKILDIARDHFKTTVFHYPFIDYYTGYCLLKLDNKDQALDFYQQASKLDFTNVFPYRVSSIDVLKSVLNFFPNDAVANMYLGDLLYYLRRHDEAIAAWEKSYTLDKLNPRVARNLAIGLFVKTQKTDSTIKLLEEAFAESNKNYRIYNELEQMYNLRKDYKSLEKLYDNNRDVIKRKGDFALNCADLYLRVGRPQDALDVVNGAFFNAVERGAGEPVRHSRYAQAQIGLGEKLLAEGNNKEAIIHFLKAYEYPETLNEIKVEKPVTVRLDYLLGTAYLKDEQKSKAKEMFNKALTQAFNKVSTDVLFRAKALEMTGKKDEAKTLVAEMLAELNAARNNQEKGIAINNYLKSEAYAYLGDPENAKKYLELALAKDLDVVVKARLESSYIKIKLR